MKRKFEIKINGQELKTMKVFSNTKAEFNGEEFEFEYELLSEDVAILRINGKNYTVRLGSMEETKQEIIANARRYDVECKSELDIIKEKYISSDSGKFKDKLVSPMPGAVVKINTEEGSEIKAGEVLLVLEAMKMENEIKADTDCIVKTIHVNEKASVDKGQLLITLNESVKN